MRAAASSRDPGRLATLRSGAQLLDDVIRRLAPEARAPDGKVDVEAVLGAAAFLLQRGPVAHRGLRRHEVPLNPGALSSNRARSARRVLISSWAYRTIPRAPSSSVSHAEAHLIAPTPPEAEPNSERDGRSGEDDLPAGGLLVELADDDDVLHLGDEVVLLQAEEVTDALQA